MACFIAPAVEAIVVTVLASRAQQREKAEKPAVEKPAQHLESALPWSRKLNWLKEMLWGGVLLLAVEHIWHGEVVPWPPFLTAIRDPAAVGPMLTEILTVGVSMAALVTAVWFGMTLVAERRLKARRTKAALK